VPRAPLYKGTTIQEPLCQQEGRTSQCATRGSTGRTSTCAAVAADNECSRMLRGVVEAPVYNPLTPKGRKTRATRACGPHGNVGASSQRRELSVQDVYGEGCIPQSPVHRYLFGLPWRKTTDTPGRGRRSCWCCASASTYRDGPSITRGAGTKRPPRARRISLCTKRGITYGGSQEPLW